MQVRYFEDLAPKDLMELDLRETAEETEAEPALESEEEEEKLLQRL